MLKLGSSIAIGLFLFCAAISAEAEICQQLPKGTSVEAVCLIKQYLQPLVKELTKPVYVSHWFKLGDGAVPDAAEYAHLASQRYWQRRREKPKEYSAHGHALYAAVDSVVSREHGGERWAMLELRLPRGFRMLDITRYKWEKMPKMPKMPPPLIASLQAIGCDKTNYEAFLFMEKSTSSLECVQALRSAFEDELKLDGFAYTYSSTTFAECKPSQGPAKNRSAAFVIMSDRWMTPGSARIFSENNLEDVAGRIRIQSQFMKEKQEFPIKAEVMKLSGVAAPEDHTLSGTSVHCDGGMCTGELVFTKQEKWGSDTRRRIPTQYQFDMPWPVPISGERGVRKESSIPELLWKDLDGQKTDADLGQWMRENLYACGDSDDYQ